MPKILRIINRLNIGGPTYNVGILTKYLSPQYDTLLLAGQKDISEESSDFILEDLGITPHYIPDMYRAINPLRDWPAFRQICAVIRNFKPDIVHTHAAKAGAIGRLAAKAMGVPVVVHTFHGHVFHSYFDPLKTRFFLETERALAKISHRIVAISPEQKRELAHVYKVCKAEKISVVPLGFDLLRFEQKQAEKRAIFRHQYQLSDNEVAIVIVGRLVPIKNHVLLLNSFAQIVPNLNRPAKIFIVGDGEEKPALTQLTADLGLTDKVVFTSWIKEIDEVFAGSDLVALCSRNEGTPVTLIEAQAAGKPIISTDVGGIADAVLPGQTALLVPNNHVAAYAETLQQLIENADLRHSLSIAGRSFVNKQYGYQRLVSDMADLYAKLLGT